MWNGLLGAVSAADRLGAAWLEIHAEQHEALGGREPSLILDSRIDAASERLEISVGAAARPAARVVSVDLSRIERAVRRRFSPLRLVAASMVEQVMGRHLERFPEIERSKRPRPEALAAPGPTVERLCRSLEQRVDVVLVGGQGTQKTASAASVAYRLEGRGHACAWLDLRDGRAGAETLAWEI